MLYEFESHRLQAQRRLALRCAQGLMLAVVAKCGSNFVGCVAVVHGPY